MALKTDYKEDILASGNTRRKYNMITNDDGTVSFEDVTDYTQVGDSFGSGDINSVNTAVNQLSDNVHILKIGYCPEREIGSTYKEIKEKIEVPDGTVSVIPFFNFLQLVTVSDFKLTGIFHTFENGVHYLETNGTNVSFQMAYICIDKARE